MSHEFFKPGGKLNAKRTGANKYTFSIPLPEDADGRTARECPEADCSPGYFKVKMGTGITGKQTTAFCPYCRCERDPGDFTTEEQAAYAKKLVEREALGGMNKMVRDALGIGPTGKRSFGGGMLKMEMSLKESRLPHVSRPFEELLQRSVVCPHCTLDHGVFGLAVWCADCGKDIFLAHVQGEFNVIESMLGDVVRRREVLGPRVAARDLENCLEDVVSIYEAVLRVLFVRNLRQKQTPESDIETAMKKIGNRFQNVTLSSEIYEKQVGILLFDGLQPKQVTAWTETFEKRHPITHNLGVVDRKYLQRIQSAEQEGREIMVSEKEIRETIAIIQLVIENAHTRLFPVPTT